MSRVRLFPWGIVLPVLVAVLTVGTLIHMAAAGVTQRPLGPLPASFNAETTRVHVTATYLSAIDTTSHGGSANLDLVANQSAKTNIILLKPTTSTLNRALPVFSSHLRGVFSKAGMGTSGSDLNEDQTLAGVRMLATWDSTATVNKRIASGARWALSGALGLMPNRDATETEAWADTSYAGASGFDRTQWPFAWAWTSALAVGDTLVLDTTIPMQEWLSDRWAEQGIAIVNPDTTELNSLTRLTRSSLVWEVVQVASTPDTVTVGTPSVVVTRYGQAIPEGVRVRQ
jgi:hypothetical protein